MYKGIGLDRNIKLSWLDAAAAYRLETDDAAELRARLGPVVGEHLTGADAKRKTIDNLINTWLKSETLAPDLYAEALDTFENTTATEDRLWLHYGLILLYYPFFRTCVIAIGQMSRLDETITTRMVKERLSAELGDLGSLKRSAERTVASLRDWGILVDSKQRYAYTPLRRHFSASSTDLEAWMLAIALTAHPAQELPFADLLRLPELFPFRFTITLDHLRQSDRFAVHRQGVGWDMVRLTEGI